MDAQTSADTRLTYVTTGILLEKLVNSRRMDMYTHVIIDEVHERDKDVDFALLLVKKFLKTNSQRVKVILMSATFDSSSFAKYFTLSSKGDSAPVIEVYGKSKEVTEHYLPELQTLIKRMPEFDICKPMLDPCLYEAVMKLMCVFDKIEKAEQNASHEQEYAPVRGAVLIFLPGYDEIAALSDTLKNPSFNKKYWIIPLHSSITLEEQSKVFKDAPPHHRKVIISTNIAESSITVPDVKYVIDFCLTKNLVTDQYTNYTCLQLEWASKSNCIQRKGRAGRVDIGRVYRMVPRSFYDELPEYGTPEIKRVPLTSTILHVKKLNICEPLEMLAFALEPPNILDIENAIIQLKEALGLLAKGSNPYDGELTFVGQVMANLPLDIKLSKLIIFGFVFHCLEECIIIAASLSLQSFFARPFQKALEAYRSRLAWANDTFSDCLAYLNAYKTWREFMSQSRFRQPGGLSENKWCELNFIQMRRIREVDLLIKEIKSRLANHGIQEHHHHQNIARQSEESKILMLKVVIAGAFFPHYFLQENLDEQEIEREINENDPHSTVVITGLPPDQGLLYAFALKDMMACCGDSMDIEFEGQKAYIKFHRKSDINASSILQSVYLAVKMRLLRIPLGLAVFSHAEAERKIQQIRQSKSSLSENKFPINRYAVKLNPFSKIKRIPLPPPINRYTQIFISHFINCGHFWAQSPTLENTNYLKFLDLSINKRQGQNLMPLTHKPVPEMLCLAPYSDAESGIMPKYYRAQIQKVMGSTVEVFFIDYGNVENVEVEQLREIDENTPDVLTTPAL
ncbi:putative ATP-dependent RNA helicase TDRD9, partial [Stegodyphus mimosarum]